MVDAAVLTGVAVIPEGQVECLAHFAMLEQGGVAFCRNLGDFILHGRHHQLVLARLLVGPDGHHVAGDIYASGVLVVHAEGDLIRVRLYALVVLAADEPRGVVALQLHHDLERVAQVVLRLRQAQHLVALHVAAHHATTQHHGGAVPEIDTGDVLHEVVQCGVAHGIVVDEEAVVGKAVSLLHGLHGVGTTRDAQFEASLRVGHNGLAAGIVHQFAIQPERYAGHGNRGVAVIDVAAIYIIGVEEEVEVLGPVRAIGETHLPLGIRAGVAALIASGGDGDIVGAVGLIGQVAEHVVACVIGRGGVACAGPHHVVARSALHGDARHGRAVGHTYVAFDHARRLARCTGDDAAVHMGTLTLIDALHAVVIALLYQDCLVLVVELVQVGGDGVGPPSVGVGRVLAAQDAEVVVVAAAGLPSQLHAALPPDVLGINDAVAVEEHVVGIVACLGLLHAHQQAVGRRVEDGQWRCATAQNYVEGVVHALARQLLGEAVLLRGIVVVGQIYQPVLHALFAVHIDAQQQTGAFVPDGRVAGRWFGLRHLGHGIVTDNLPLVAELGDYIRRIHIPTACGIENGVLIYLGHGFVVAVFRPAAA